MIDCSATPKVIKLVVSKGLCIGCGVCIPLCKSKSIKIDWNSDGFYEPVKVTTCTSDGDCVKVCPFNPRPQIEVRTEDELADIFIENSRRDFRIGKYMNLYAGFANKYRLNSSSGGMATYIQIQLIKKGIVNHIISVRESKSQGIHYEYCINSSSEDVLNSSKTKYYPVTLATVLTQINRLEGKIALVGVGCFIKAIRLAQYYNPNYREKIPFLIGIICGGIKSRFYSDFLAANLGIKSKDYIKPQFRKKNLSSHASDYMFSCINTTNNNEQMLSMNQVGDMWGTGYFKAKACDFCDDVTTELADISLGDAWIQPYLQDGKGNNVIVVRSSLANNLIIKGVEENEIQLRSLTIEELIQSQSGSFNHRQNGLKFRLLLKHSFPPKRKYISNNNPFFILVVSIRSIVRQKSIVLWKRYNDNIEKFKSKMRLYLKILNKMTNLYHKSNRK